MSRYVIRTSADAIILIWRTSAPQILQRPLKAKEYRYHSLRMTFNIEKPYLLTKT